MRRIAAICTVIALSLSVAGCGANKHVDGHTHDHDHHDEPVQSSYIIQDKPKPIAQLMEGKTGVVMMSMTDRGVEPSTITAKLGDEVRIYVKNNGTKEHNLVIPQFGVVTRNMAPGADNYIAFTASIKGSWPFFSDASNKGAKAEAGLQGILKVE